MEQFKKRLLPLFLIPVVILLLGFPVSLAEEKPRLTAPGGAETDLNSSITKCYGIANKPVEAHWKNYSLGANYLEYNRKEGTVHGQGKVKILQHSPTDRVINCEEMFLVLEKEFFVAQKDVKIIYDENTSLSGDALEWDRKSDMVTVTGTPQLKHKDWLVDADRIEGQVNGGIITFFGPVKGVGSDASFTAGKVIFDRPQDKIFLKNNPVVVQGKNVLSAPEMVYDLKTRKFSTKSDLKVN